MGAALMPPTTAGHAESCVLIFDTPAGPLEAHQCTCGRLFDAARLAAHLTRGAGK